MRKKVNQHRNRTYQWKHRITIMIHLLRLQWPQQAFPLPGTLEKLKQLVVEVNMAQWAPLKLIASFRRQEVPQNQQHFRLLIRLVFRVIAIVTRTMVISSSFYLYWWSAMRWHACRYWIGENQTKERQKLEKNLKKKFVYTNMVRRCR